MNTRIFGFIAVAVMLFSATYAFAGTITFNPAMTMPQGAHFSAEVMMDPGGTPVLGAEIMAHYDPALVRLDGIEAGNWFSAQGTSGSGYFFYDHTASAAAGTIHFSGALLGTTSPASGSLATCWFTVLSAGLCPLDFVAIDVRGTGNSHLDFAHSEDDQISLPQATMRFEPSTTVAVNVDFIASLAIGTGSYEVGFVDAVVAFDPAVVALTSIEPGPWITGQGVQYSFVDHSTPGVAQVHLTVEFLDGAGAGDGIIAMCHFTALQAGISPLTFGLVAVHDGEGQALPCAGSAGDRIVVDEAVPTESTTFSDIKASFR